MKLIKFLVHINFFIALYGTAAFAYLALSVKAPVDWLEAVSIFILMWQVYTFDRFVVHPEDEVAVDADINIMRFILRHRTIFKFALLLSALAEVVICIINIKLLFTFLLGAVLGIL